jgi:hypothetical protein
MQSSSFEIAREAVSWQCAVRHAHLARTTRDSTELPGAFHADGIARSQGLSQSLHRRQQGSRVQLPSKMCAEEKARKANVEGHWDLRTTPSLRRGVSLTLSPSSATRDARSRELNMQDGDEGRSTGRWEVRSSRSESDRSPGGKRKLPPSASPAKRLEARHRTEPPHLSIRSTPAGTS